MKGRNSQVARIYKILTILEGAPQGLTISDIADRLEQRGFEVTGRTVYRDLDALKAAGFPLDKKGKSDDNAVRWTLESRAKVSHYLVLSSRELLSLYLARGSLIPLRDTPFFEDLEATFQKIEDKLGKASLAHLEELSSEFHFEPGPRWGLGIDPDTTETIRAACSERQMLELVYKSVNSQTTKLRRLGPHFLYFAKGSLYLVAEDMSDKKVKTFSVPRIQSAEMLNEPYEGTPVDAEQYFSSSFGVFRGKESCKVRIRIQSKLASYVKERRWHLSQKIVSLEGGDIELSFDIAITPDLIQWVLGFGAAALVIEPKELSESVKNEALKTVEMYEQIKKEAS